jgi:hypothetical protein
MFSATYYILSYKALHHFTLYLPSHFLIDPLNLYFEQETNDDIVQDKKMKMIGSQGKAKY